MNTEEVAHNDANLEAMLGRFQIDEPEGFKCGNSQKIERVCVNPECQSSSLICSNVACSKCKGEDGSVPR